MTGKRNRHTPSGEQPPSSTGFSGLIHVFQPGNWRSIIPIQRTLKRNINAVSPVTSFGQVMQQHKYRSGKTLRLATVNEHDSGQLGQQWWLSTSVDRRPSDDDQRRWQR